MSEALPRLSTCSDVQQGPSWGHPHRMRPWAAAFVPIWVPTVWPRGGFGAVVQLCHLHADGLASADGYSQKCLDLIPFTDFFLPPP